MLKNKYKNDYAPQMNGQFVYIGDRYTLHLTEEDKKKTNWQNLLYGFIFLAIEIILGLLNPDSSRTAWVVYPYIFLFLPTAYMLIGAFTYFHAEIAMEKADYDGGIVRMRRSVYGILALSGCNIVLDLLFIILHRDQIDLLRECIYLGLLILLLLVALSFGRFFDRNYTNLTIDKH